MIKFYLRFIIFIGIVLLQPLVWGNESRSIKRDTSVFPPGSCIDRCHVNYMAYRSLYQGEVFKHKTHSPDQGLKCSQCHNNDAVNTKTHGNLVIQTKDCKACHHKEASNEDCLKCHADVKGYMNGEIQNIVTKIPDWMSRAVFCTDCHKQELNGFSFKAVRNYCVGCHNADYGLLYDAWKETLDNKIKQICKNDTSAINLKNISRLIETYGMHNIRLSQVLLKTIEK